MGDDYYDKSPTTKFWDGYNHEKNVLIDEFRGMIDISHMLKWLDKYKCSVEIKGSAKAFCGENIIITSNIHPREWYPNLDDMTRDALLNRMEITHFQNPFNLNLNIDISDEVDELINSL